MLKPGTRLKRRSEFERVLRAGRRAARGRLVVHWQGGDAAPADERTESSQPKAGLVVSKAVGDAVTRNTVKRRLRHLLADRMTEWPADSRIVVRALPGAAGLRYAELAADLDAAVGAARRARTREGGGTAAGPGTSRTRGRSRRPDAVGGAR